jgi:uncharacterized protein (DUF58 family)
VSAATVNPFETLQQRLRKTRIGQVVFKKRTKFFMVPTRFGFLFFAGLLSMMFVGATYTNNLVYLLAFVLFSLGMITMLQTHANLKYLSILNLNVQPGFAGDSLAATFTVSNRSSLSCHSVEIEAIFQGERASTILRHIPELGRASGHLELKTTKRGVYQLEGLRISTVFPLGLFRAWFWTDTHASVVVFPVPKGSLGLAATAIKAGETGLGSTANGEDFSGHKIFTQGHSLRHVDWKAFARGRPKMLKIFQDGSSQVYKIDLQQIALPDTEAKLSQAAQWILNAKQKQQAVSLRLNRGWTATSSESSHFVRCLKELATYEG